MNSDFYEKLIRHEKPCAVELDPPSKIQDYDRFLQGTETLKQAGADIITMADCPSANPRIDSCIAACNVFNSVGIDVIPHLTCRDKNIVALKSQILGLFAVGIRNAIIVTGDPVPTEKRTEVKPVFQFSSRGFASFADTVNNDELSGQMHFFGALNVNAVNFKEQVKIAKEKIANGIVGLFTQPILSEQGFNNLRIARQELDCFLLGGIMPVVSERNARFMNGNINGIKIDEEYIRMYVGKSKEECEKIAIEISSDMAERISEYSDGYYFITPFLRAELIAEILKRTY